MCTGSNDYEVLRLVIHALCGGSTCRWWLPRTPDSGARCWHGVPHLPVQRGLRFCLKARIPSW